MCLITQRVFAGRSPDEKMLKDMLGEAPGPLNFTMFLTLFGDKLKGMSPQEQALALGNKHFQFKFTFVAQRGVANRNVMISFRWQNFILYAFSSYSKKYAPKCFPVYTEYKFAVQTQISNVQCQYQLLKKSLPC